MCLLILLAFAFLPHCYKHWHHCVFEDVVSYLGDFTVL